MTWGNILAGCLVCCSLLVFGVVLWFRLWWQSQQQFLVSNDWQAEQRARELADDAEWQGLKDDLGRIEDYYERG